MGKRIMFRTRPVGERFKADGGEFVVMEAVDVMKPCGDCAVRDLDDCVADIELVGLCYSGMRSDSKQVFFKRAE